jgi:hypothetical protein
MDWASEKLFAKAKLYGERAHEQRIDSPLFGMWMSLCLELLSRAALSKIHPVLLADPREEGNIHYSFGVNPKTNPRSIQAKTVFARCSIFVPDFTDQMAAQCLIIADRRNKELHTEARRLKDTIMQRGFLKLMRYSTYCLNSWVQILNNSLEMSKQRWPAEC